jgi:hypothetical protein
MLSLFVSALALADGPPAMDPLVYSGTLEEGGAAVTGQRDIKLVLWSDPTQSTAAHRKCDTIPPAKTSVAGGRFSLPLDPLCVAAVKANAELWVEVIVESQSLPRTKLSAVPYALEAGRAASAASAAGALLTELVPAGAVMAWAGVQAPQGWLLCDGTAVSRTTYARLFAVVGVAHGAGDGSTTFNVPDYRGRFLRGVDGASGRDPDAANRLAMAPGGNTGALVGSVQDDGLRSHEHSYFLVLGRASSSFGSGSWQSLPFDYNTFTYRTTDAGFPDGGALQAETRPKNASVSFIIKL